MVEDPRVLIQAHDGEESIEDLVEDLCPFLSNRAFWDGIVEEPNHEQEEHNKAGSNEKEPNKKSFIHWVLDPLLAESNNGFPVDLSDKRDMEAVAAIYGAGYEIRM